MLNSVLIERFKSVERAEFSLGRITVLVGPNNAGKSACLQAIQFGVSIAQSLELTKSRGWSKDVRSGSLSTQQLVYTPLRDVDALAHGGALQTNKSEIAVQLDTDAGQYRVAVSKGKNKNIQVKMLGESLGKSLQKLDQPYSVVAPGLAGIPAVESYQSKGVVQRAAARGDANSVFRNVLLLLSKNTHDWTQFEARLAEVFPDVRLEVEFDEASDEYISAWATRESGPRLPIESSGTGVLQAVQVLSYVGLYKPKLLILDEPDAHLHPDNQRKLARLLGALAKENQFQVILSTHSRHMLDALGDQSATVHWMSAGEFRDEEFDRVSALLELGALDAGDRLQNGATRRIFLTEDSDEDLIRPLILSSGWGEDEISIWPYKGSGEVKSARILTEFIKKHAPGTSITVHRDRDYLNENQMAEYEASIVALGATPFLTSGTDIESHFLDLAHLQTIYPELDVATLEDILQRATAETTAVSLEKMISTRNDADVIERRKLGKPPRAGVVALACTRELESDPVKYRHGKKTMGAFRRLLDAEHQLGNREVFAPSEALRVEALARPDDL